MADIQLRFNKDVLTLSTTLRSFFAEHDFDIASELDYVVLCEPELLEEEYRLESVIHTPVFVAPTNAITATRLAHERFEGRAVDLAGAAYAQAAAFKPSEPFVILAENEKKSITTAESGIYRTPRSVPSENRRNETYPPPL